MRITMTSGSDIVNRLEKPSLSDTSGRAGPLNIEFRQSLAELASSQRLQFHVWLSLQRILLLPSNSIC